MDSLDRAATQDEIRAMSRLLERVAQAGAIGFKHGLYYPLAPRCRPEEVIDLLSLVSRFGAIYTTHMRDEEDGVELSLLESFDAAKRGRVPLVISHHKCMGSEKHGPSDSTHRLNDQARTTQAVGLDAYPYVAGSTVLMGAMVRKSSRVLIAWSKPHPEIRGQDLSDIAREWDCSIDDAIERLSPAGAIYFHMSEEDVHRILAHPATMIGSDGLPHDASAPLAVGRVSSCSGTLCPRSQALPARGSGPQDDQPAREDVQAEGPRLHRSRELRGFGTCSTQLRSPTRRHSRPAAAAAGIRAVFVNGKTAAIDGVVEQARSRGTQRPRQILEEAGCPRRTPLARTQQDNDVGRREAIVWKHRDQPTFPQVLGDVPFGANDDAEAGDRPLAHHFAVIAGEMRSNSDRLHLAGGVDDWPEGDVLVVFPQGDALMSL